MGKQKSQIPLERGRGT